MFRAMVIASVLASSASADFFLTYVPDVVPWNEETDVSVRLQSHPGVDQIVGAIGFSYDDMSEAYAAIHPVSFSWTPEVMHDPGLWFIDEDLPSPEGVAFFPGAVVEIPDGMEVEMALLTVHPQGPESLGAWEWDSNLVIADQGFPSPVIKGGDPTVITVVPEPSTVILLAGGCLIVIGRHAGISGTIHGVNRPPPIPI